MNPEIFKLLKDILRFIEDEHSFIQHIEVDKKYGLLKTLSEEELKAYVTSMKKPSYMKNNQFVRDLCNT